MSSPALRLDGSIPPPLSPLLPAADSTESTLTTVVPASSLDVLLQRSDLWRGAQLAHGPTATHPSGFAELDAELPGGGWPTAASIELMPEPGAAAAHRSNLPARGDGALSLLLPTIARLTRAGRWVALINPPLLPHAPAWLQAGADLAHLLQVTADARTHLWACERCLRSGAVAAAIAWPGLLSFAARKRLQLAAESGGSSFFTLLPATATVQSSPAPLRLVVAAQREGIAVRILKRRGPHCEGTLSLPLCRPLPDRKRAESPPVEGLPHALARPLAARSPADRAPHPTAA